MTIHYKATRLDGADFRTGTVDYAGAMDSGEVLRHPSEDLTPDRPSTYLSISVDPGSTLLGGKWPCRLFEVESEGPAVDGLSACRNKRAVSALRVVREIEAWRALGPNGEEVVAFLDSVPSVINAARGAAAAAAGALVVKDLITPERFDALMRPWRILTGEVEV